MRNTYAQHDCAVECLSPLACVVYLFTIAQLERPSPPGAPGLFVHLLPPLVLAQQLRFNFFQWTEYINAAMQACNKRTTSNAQRVAKWALLPTDFSVEGETCRLDLGGLTAVIYIAQ